MKRVLLWLKDYWYVPVFILASILAYILFRQRVPRKQIELELKAIQASRSIREYKERVGLEKAKASINRWYESEKHALTEEQRRKTERLRNDPVAMSKALVRAGR